MLHDLKVLLANSRVILPILSWCNFILYFRCRESWGVEILPRHSKFLSKYGVFIGIINNYNFIKIIYFTYGVMFPTLFLMWLKLKAKF